VRGPELRHIACVLCLACIVPTAGCWGLFHEEPKLEVNVTLPGEAPAGETFQMVVDVSNPHPAAVYSIAWMSTSRS
jgi:hypothetical protein